ncbi:YfiR family protein [Vibrio vulnificus]|uniref:YfiR family protein n=1 Tax=Vibrio vulnificus TaxID=672 RepID=UPI001028DABB|nr:YfiR family protein [Vibrio vulnificus]EGQ9932507.1 YfiR family protein [Vibrio vulnificus]ELI0611185.1 YfiR family protein [Vibrio vulnificus]MCU8273350.1 YfiR family protein [Vibrio vulnificus]RZQ17692.1 YfiR family protein [Vibrio vulnificus]HAS8338278.1 YfiR family protein [Vibrio vulnificus]
MRQSRLSAKLLCRIALFLGVYCLAAPAWPKYSDEDLKAVYLYRFASLADWQSTPLAQQKTRYCGEFNSVIAERLKAIVETQPEAATFSYLEEVDPQESCHLVFVESNPQTVLPTLQLRYPHALLVGNGEKFVRLGGMIAFIKVNNRILPLISRKHVEPSQIRLRAQLLSIAQLFEEPTQ